MSRISFTLCGRVCAALLIVSALVSAPPAGAQSTAVTDTSSGVTKYQFFPFDVPASLGTGTIPRGINNKGTIAGIYTSAADSAYHAFVYKQGQFTDVVVPGAAVTGLFAINNNGEAVGFYATATEQHLFLRANDGSLTLLNDPVAPGSLPQPYAINDAGTIVGYVVDSNYNGHGLILSKGGKARVYNYPGSFYTVLRGINNAGQMVGYYLDADYFAHGFLLNKDMTVARALEVQGARETVPSGISNTGQIDGIAYFGVKEDLGRSFTLNLSGGGYTVLSFPGPNKGTHLSSLNDSGILLGTYDFTSGNANAHGFLAVPQASP